MYQQTEPDSGKKSTANGNKKFTKTIHNDTLTAISYIGS